MRAVRRRATSRTVRERELVLAFGSQLRVDPVDAAGAGRIASYVTKYVVKGVESGRRSTGGSAKGS